MATRARSERHEHDWFPVAMDFDGKFLILECGEAGCNADRVWVNLHSLDPKGEHE